MPFLVGYFLKTSTQEDQIFVLIYGRFSRSKDSERFPTGADRGTFKHYHTTVFKTINILKLV